MHVVLTIVVCSLLRCGSVLGNRLGASTVREVAPASPSPFAVASPAVRHAGAPATSGPQGTPTTAPTVPTSQHEAKVVAAPTLPAAALQQQAPRPNDHVAGASSVKTAYNASLPVTSGFSDALRGSQGSRESGLSSPVAQPPSTAVNVSGALAVAVQHIPPQPASANVSLVLPATAVTPPSHAVNASAATVDKHATETPPLGPALLNTHLLGGVVHLGHVEHSNGGTSAGAGVSASTGAGASESTAAAKETISPQSWYAIYFSFAFILKTLCMLSNVVFQAAPVPQVFSFYKMGSTAELDAAPYVSILFGCFQWCFYGFFAFAETTKSGFLVLVYSNILGVFLGISYLWTFQTNCTNAKALSKLRVYYMFAGSILGIEIFAMMILPNQRALFFCGTVASVCSVLGALSLLSTVSMVIETKCSSSINVPLLFVGFASCVLWAMCGFMLRDNLIMIPQFVSMCFQAVAFAMVCYYPRDPPAEEVGKCVASPCSVATPVPAIDGGSSSPGELHCGTPKSLVLNLSASETLDERRQLMPSRSSNRHIPAGTCNLPDVDSGTQSRLTGTSYGSVGNSLGPRPRTVDDAAMFDPVGRSSSTPAMHFQGLVEPLRAHHERSEEDEDESQDDDNFDGIVGETGCT